MSKEGQAQLTQTAGERDEFTRVVLRAVYQQLFRKPLAVGTQRPSGYKTGTEVRSEICQILSSGQGGTSPDGTLLTPKQAIEKRFNEHAADSGVLTLVPFELSGEQFDGLRRALVDERRYARLRDIREGTLSEVRGPNAQGILHVGPLELGLLYQWLFNPVDTFQAHNYLHAMKKAAKESGAEAVKAVLGVLFNDREFTGILWEKFQYGFYIVSLEFDEGIPELITEFVRDPLLSELEPYEGGGVCIVPGSNKAVACY